MKAADSTLSARVVELTRRCSSDVATVRRLIHAHPEPGWAEFVTTHLIRRRLTDLGDGLRICWGADLGLGARLGIYPRQQEEAARQAVSAGVPQPEVEEMVRYGTGVVCDIGSERPSRTVVLRVDIDALPITETNEENHRPNAEGFRSRIDGYSHACGHDGHTAIGLGVAAVLVECLAEMPDARVRIIFQPAEEGTRGARAFVDAGWIDSADAFFSLHLDNRSPLELDSVASGVDGILGTMKFDIDVIGRSSHAAESPDLGIDALAAAVDLYTRIGSLPRPGGALLGCHVLRAGTARNVIADRAFLQGEVRARSDTDTCLLWDRVVALAQEISDRHRARIDARLVGASAPGASNDAGRQVVAAACAAVRINDIGVMEFGASDDAAEMIAKLRPGRPASYFLVGGGGNTDAHSADFDVADRALEVGVKTMAMSALLALGSGRE